MEKDKIFEKVKELLSINLGIDKDDIFEASSLRNDFDVAKDYEMIELLMILEEGFNLPCCDNDFYFINDVKTVKDIVAYVEKKLGEK